MYAKGIITWDIEAHLKKLYDLDISDSTINRKKDVIGMYVRKNEGAKFWLSIINELKNRGVQDILMACVDGLNGFPQAIEAVYHPPNPEYHELCILQRSEKTYGRFKNGLYSTR